MLLGTIILICGLECVMAVVALAAPVEVTPPEVSGNVSLGGKIYCETGTWSSVEEGFRFTWIRSGQPIEHEENLEGPVYELKPADEGHEIWCIVTARGEGNEVKAESSNRVEFPLAGTKEPKAPALEGPPGVSGEGKVGAQQVTTGQASNGPPAPDAQLAVNTLTTNGSGIVTAVVRCPAAAMSCTGTITLKTLTPVIATTTQHGVKPEAAILTLATEKLKAAGGNTATVRLHLSAFGRELLARTDVLRVRATITVHDPAGATHTAETVVTIRRARAKRKG